MQALTREYFAECARKGWKAMSATEREARLTKLARARKKAAKARQAQAAKDKEERAIGTKTDWSKAQAAKRNGKGKP